MRFQHGLICALCVAALLPLQVARAQDSTLGATLQGIRARLLEANPELRAMGYELEAAGARELPAGAFPDPMLEIEWRDIESGHPTLDPSAVGATRYQFQQRFPLWGKRGLAREMAHAQTRVVDAERRARALELLAEAERAYVRYWYAVEARNTLDRVIATTGDIEKLATARYRSGIVPMQDPLKAQVELTLMQRERIELEAQRAEAVADLNTVLGRSPDLPFALPVQVPELSVPWTLDYLMERVEQVHPQMLAAASAIEAARRKRELSYRNRYPDLTVSVAPIQTGQRVGAWDFMLGIEIPLQQGRRRAEEREARLLEHAAETRLESVRSELRGQAGARYAIWRAAEQQRALVHDSLLGQTEASYRAARASYALGAVDFMTLLEALRQWRNAELEQFSVSRDAFESAATLRALIGSLTP